ncbi:MAG: hypothetical protein J6R67_10515 [Treponema sp.]|nr:hypothetical protein [Treponema sp.]
MGFVVLLIVFALVGFFVGVAKAADSADSGPGARNSLPDRGWSDAEFDEELEEDFLIDEPRSRKGGGSIFGSKSYESDFERLMKPGSDEAAWFNAADDAGYDPENW